MISPSELLEASTRGILDKNNPVKLCPYKRTRTKQGYSFISLNRGKARTISATVQLDVDWKHEEEIGYLRNVNCKINTQEKIKGDYCILYQDLVIFLNDFGSYTESMRQYEYGGKAVEIDKLPLVNGKLNPEGVYGFSSLDLLSTFDKYNILPDQVALTDEFMEQGIFLVKVNESLSLSKLKRENGKTYQMRVDRLSIRAVNVDRNTIIRFIMDLLEYGSNNEFFGLSGEYNIEEINNYDDYSNLRGIRYEITLSICYNIFVIEDISEKKISTILFKIKETPNGFS